ncbi:MAG TPA: methyltransferase domain-containing protein [Solirubrobacterales bacterium]|nr:methyltransferase domain-containing protein [Solirubrobacterales bacterium]
MSEQSSSPTPVRQEAPNVEYGSYYFRHDCGIPYERNEHWLGFFGAMADAIVRDLRPTTVLDAGCAMGFLVEALRERGVEAWGIDVSEHAISQVHESVAAYCQVGSLTDPLPRRYDLIVSVEVLEHIPPAEANAAVANLCAATDRLLLSTTPDDFGEATHLNVQAPEAWSAMLAQNGFLRETEHDVSYVTPWAALYARSAEPLAEAVRRYDRAWWRQHRETEQLRDSLLNAHNRLAELEQQAGAGPARAETEAELDRREAEILRLRDLLIGMEHELGGARGRLAVYEDRTNRIESAKAQLAAKVPGSGFLLTLVLRLLRGRR